MNASGAAASDAAPGTLQSAVGARFDTATSWKVRFWAPLVLGLIMLFDSWDSIVIAYVMPSLREQWGLSTLEVGAIISAGYGGQFFGALVLGPAGERFGRMPVFHFAIITMCALSVGCAFAPNELVFLVLRALQGVAIGGALPVCVSYINEMAPTPTRGRYFSIFQFLMVSGFSVASIASAVVIPTLGWQAMFLIGAAPVLLIPLVMATLPESPRWLVRMGRVEATNKALAKLGLPALEPGLPLGVEDEAARKTPILALFAPAYRWRTIVVAALWFFASLVSFAFATWAPSLYVSEFGLELADALRYSALAGGIYLFVPLLFAAIIDKLGRRGPAILAAAVATAALVALVTIDYTQTSLIVALITTGWVAAASVSIILWPYSADIFPTHLRATGLGLSSSLARAASMLTPLVVAGVLTTTGSVRYVFAALAVSAFVVTLTWVFCTRETARKSLEDLA